MRRILTIAGCALAMCGTSALTPALAEGPAPFPDFSAKRVKPPKPGRRHRITVQIAPRPLVSAGPAQASKAALTPTATPASKGNYDWFWSEVSPSLTASGPGRLAPALRSLENPPAGKSVAAPRLQKLQDIARAQGVDILRYTVGTGVSPALVLAVIAVESAGRSDAVSRAGAQGLMQLMPDTATRFGVTDSLSSTQNIQGGIAYLDWLLKKFAGDPILALAGYNAGENSISAHDGVPPFAETRDYVPKVLAAFNVAKGLCRTPPQLISDGCVFAVN